MSKNENIMELTRGTVMLLQAARADVETGYSGYSKSKKRTRIFSFLSIFHPEIPLAKRLKLAWEMASDD